MTELLHIAVACSDVGEFPTSDFTLSCDPAVTTVAAVAEMVGFGPGPLCIDGRSYPGSSTLSETPIADGSVISNPADRDRSDDQSTPVVRFSQIAGPAAGRTFDLPAGSYRIQDGGIRRTSSSDGRMVHVDAGGATIDPCGLLTVVDGQLLRRPHRTGITEDSVINIGTAQYAIGPPIEVVPPVHPSGPIHRVPRAAAVPPEANFVVPPLPKAPAEPSPLSWIALLAPLPAAVIMAMVLGPRFLLFAGLSPIAMLARWYDVRRRTAKQQRDYDSSMRLARNATREQVLTARAAARRYALVSQPSLPELLERAIRHDPKLWERRPGHHDFGVVSVGCGHRPWRFEPKVPAVLTDVVASIGHLDSVPATIDLSQGSVGVVGDRRLVVGVARSLVAQLVVLSGPGDAALGYIPRLKKLDAVADWDWLKWLPHIGTPPRIATDDAALHALVATAYRSAVGTGPVGQSDESLPFTVLVVDGVEQLQRPGSPLRRALSESSGIRGIVLADHADQLPASCRWVVSVDSEGLLSLADMSSGRQDSGFTPIAINQIDAAAMARSLARHSDPDATQGTAELPAQVLLPSITGAIDAGSVLDRWEQNGPDPDLVALLGVAGEGLMEVDLVQDGPHALLAGTTGAGKSELLRSFVLSLATRYSSDVVNFVLIDYKGGGAFERCSELPHSVAMVTDLDEHLGARALRSLQAELRFREVTFRDAGVADLGDYRRTGGVLPRLVVVVDEFATMAAELPDFLDSLVDIAQRGRSLGIHMILATQRPAGVVDAKIKSNTNLRISLRVQDDSDSQDVLGTTDAARLQRSEIGRGFVRMGAGNIVPFQSAYAGGKSPVVGRMGDLFLENYRILDTVPEIAAECDDDRPTDIDRMVSEICLAHEKSGRGEPRPPWLPPLPATLSVSDLESWTVDADDSITFGLLDAPGRQRRETLPFRPGDESLIVYGAKGSQNCETLLAILVQSMRRFSADELHLYLFDSGTAGLSALRDAQHVGAYICHDDDELLTRALDLVDGLVTRRKRTDENPSSRQPLPKVIVAINGLGPLLERLNETGDHATLSRLSALVRETAQLNISVVGSATNDRQIPSRISAQIERSILHRLIDPAAVIAFGLRPRDIPALDGRMVVDVATGLDGVAALVTTTELTDTLESSGCASNRPPLRLRVLKPVIASTDLQLRPKVEGSRLSLPVGFSIRQVQPTSLTISDRAAVIGGPGSGRTTTLVQLATQAGLLDLDGDIVVVAGDKSRLHEVRGVLSLADVPDLNTAALVIVDDCHTIDQTVGAELKAYAEGTGSGRWIIAGLRPSEAKAMMDWTNVFRSASSGVALQPQLTDGDVFGAMFTSPTVAGLRAGQGIMVTSGASTAIQCAVVDMPG